MSMVPYAHLRAEGIGVRYSVATGNECDLNVADFTEAVLRDPEVRLILLYMEACPRPPPWRARPRWRVRARCPCWP